MKDYYKQINKESDVISEVGTIIVAIRKEINKATIDMSLKYLNDELRLSCTFYYQPWDILIKNIIRNLKRNEKCSFKIIYI